MLFVRITCHDIGKLGDRLNHLIERVEKVGAQPDSALRIAVAVIRGARPGPVVAFVAGSHGTEYTSIIAMQKLIARIDQWRH